MQKRILHSGEPGVFFSEFPHCAEAVAMPLRRDLSSEPLGFYGLHSQYRRF